MNAFSNFAGGLLLGMCVFALGAASGPTWLRYPLAVGGWLCVLATAIDCYLEFLTS